MSFRVIQPGLLSSLQDLGRYGYQKYGINVTGAMDKIALRLANLLVGNEEGEAALEITLMGPMLEFNDDTLIAITGADLMPVIDGAPLPMNAPVAVKAGAVLRFAAWRQGCRSYLAVGGGFDTPLVMQSKSTYLRGGIGGWKGRALQKNDVVTCGKPSAIAERMSATLLQNADTAFCAADWCISLPHMQQENFIQPFRITPGLQAEAFTGESLQELVTKPFKITTNADRLGYRLEGPKMNLKEPLEMISEISTCGTMQAPPDGNPIVLMADHQSVAGYPKIAQVVAADICRLAQYVPGSEIRFAYVSLEEAEKLYLEQEAFVENTKAEIQSKL